ncbi:MAG: hypothetical protein V4617_19310 [Gemmatimonadota bacterium]
MPPERVFELRSADGEPVPVYEITLQRRDFVEEGMAQGFLRALGLPITLHAAWDVTVMFKEPA